MDHPYDSDSKDWNKAATKDSSDSTKGSGNESIRNRIAPTWALGWVDGRDGRACGQRVRELGNEDVGRGLGPGPWWIRRLKARSQHAGCVAASAADSARVATHRLLRLRSRVTAAPVLLKVGPDSI
ncbi:hypothetical protein MUK42_28599 [Musa troglodytarum]|uniref:Uncharacterized protein n=1 Tax=Musa troglodytarum TaxID=320322 RepID=A0A9E7FMJ1_9LILI|nr:hypothetical protein MUK42_28599 [Musa troglodytarum]